MCLEVEGRPCVVIGGGNLAEHKVRSLLDAGATIKVVAPAFTGGLQELARRGELTLVEKPYSHGDLEDAFLAIAATGDPGVHAAAFAEAEERGVLLNAVDDIAHCHFAYPAVLRRGDFMVTISTGGKAPALAKRLRHTLARQFGPEYETLVQLLGEVREAVMPSREAEFATWAARWQQALDHDLLGLVEEGRTEEAARIVADCLAGGELPRPPGRVAIVGAGPGDPGLITVKGKELIDQADVVVYDRLVHPSLYSRKEAIYAGKGPGGHGIRQDETNALLIRLAREGKRVVRLKGGDPFVFGRGAEEAEALAQAGILFEVVPAPSSAIAAPGYAGIPVTDRRHGSSVAIVTGHCGGAKPVDFRRLAGSVDTIVILMGVSQLGSIVEELLQGGLHPETPAAIVEAGSLPSQRVLSVPLQELPEAASAAGAASPAVVVVGEVVGLRELISWFPEARPEDSSPHHLSFQRR
ncbi:MAG: siroheme synthase CysG [Actinomycetota bacterium]